MSDLKSRWAQDAWARLLESRRRRDRRRKLLVLVAGLGSAATLGFGITQRDLLDRATPFTVREIVIAGNRLVEGPEVLDLLGVRAGDPWWNYSPSKIRARVGEHPRVSALHIRYEWFHRLLVEVVEREGALTVVGNASGELTSDGWFLPAAPVGTEIDRPILRPEPGTLPPHDHRADARIRAVARLVGSLERERPDLWREISEIELTPREARAYLRSRFTVIVFEPGRNDGLWMSLPEVLADLGFRGREDVVLDLTFSRRIVVRLPDSAVPDSLAAIPRNREA